MSDRVYVFRSNNSDYESVFKEGICFYDQKMDMSKSFIRVDDNLYEYLSNAEKHESIYIIQIPEEYFKFQGDDVKVLPFPILFERDGFDPSRQLMDIFPVLVPSLISCMFRGDMGAFQNKNYNPKYNPDGLKYSKEQLDIIKRKSETLYNRFSKRNDLDSLTLYDIDAAQRTWDLSKKYYGVKDGSEPFAAQGELPDVEFDNRKQRKKALAKKKKKKKHIIEE